MKKTVKSISRFCFLLLTAALVLGLVGLPQAFAQEEDPQPVPVIRCGDYSYELNGDQTATIVEYSGNEKAVEIPVRLDGHRVSMIADQAFAYYEMESLIIPKGVAVNGRAFEYCEISDFVTLPNDVVIKSRAFEYAVLPNVLTIPEGAVVEGSSFSYCEGLRALFAAPEATIRGSAFSYSEDLRTMVCAVGSVIADKAFYDCSILEEVVLCGDVKLEGKPFRDSNRVKFTTVNDDDYTRTVGKVSGEAAEPLVKAGAIRGNTYENASLGLGCVLPEAYYLAAPEELAALMGIADDAFEQTESLADYLLDHNAWTDLLASTDSGEYVSVLVSPVTEEMKEMLEFFPLEEFAAAQGYSAVSLLTAQGCFDITFAVDDAYDGFMADDCACLYYTAREDDEPVFFRQLLYVVDDTMVTITAGTYEEDGTLDILGYFE